MKKNSFHEDSINCINKKKVFKSFVIWILNVLACVFTCTIVHVIYPNKYWRKLNSAFDMKIFFKKIKCIHRVFLHLGLCGLSKFCILNIQLKQNYCTFSSNFQYARKEGVTATQVKFPCAWVTLWYLKYGVVTFVTRKAEENTSKQ